MQLWIIGVLSISVLRIYVPTVEASPLGSSTGGFTSYRPGGERQSTSFAEGIRDWFRNMKNRLLGLGSDPQALPPAEAGNLMMELENEDPQERRRNNPGGFFLDLSNLTFNPDRDWGFRLGQWYFIRKPNDEPPPDDWKSKNYPEWPTMDDGKDDTIPPLGTMKSIDTILPLGTMKSIDTTTTVASTPDKGSPEVTEPTAEPLPKDSDNETLSSPERSRSAEVLIPSE